MVIQNKTVLSGKEVYSSLLKTSRKAFMSKFIFTGVLTLIGLITVILVLSTNNATDSLVIGFMFLTIAILYGAMALISFGRLPSKIKKQNFEIVQNGMINKFTFKEESFQLTTVSGDKSEKYEYRYEELKKIVEEDQQILFYLSASTMLFCKKDGFSTPKEMDVFFYGLSKHKIKIKKKLSEKEA